MMKERTLRSRRSSRRLKISLRGWWITKATHFPWSKASFLIKVITVGVRKKSQWGQPSSDEEASNPLVGCREKREQNIWFNQCRNSTGYLIHEEDRIIGKDLHSNGQTTEECYSTAILNLEPFLLSSTQRGDLSKESLKREGENEDTHRDVLAML